MSTKHILALSVIALGIWLNLEVQDAMAKRDIHGWESKQLHDSPPALLAGEQRDQVVGYGSPDRAGKVGRALDLTFAHLSATAPGR